MEGDNCDDVSLCVNLIGEGPVLSVVSSLRTELRGLLTTPLCDKHLRERRGLGGNEWMRVDEALKMIERRQRQGGGIETINVNSDNKFGSSLIANLKKVYVKKD